MFIRRFIRAGAIEKVFLKKWHKKALSEIQTPEGVVEIYFKPSNKESKVDQLHLLIFYI